MKDIVCLGCQRPTPKDQSGHLINGGRRRAFAKFCSECAKVQYLQWKRDNSKRHYEQDKTSSEWMEQRREYLRKGNLKRKFGIDHETYERMFIAQNGLCACCGNPETLIDLRSGLPRALAVDHNHATGEVRSLLCQACNVAFGLMAESPDRVKLLLQYAEKPKS